MEYSCVKNVESFINKCLKRSVMSSVLAMMTGRVSSSIFHENSINRTNHDVDLVLNGGNERIWDAFKFYKMPKDVPMDFKYKTKIGYYYRTMVA